MTAVRDDERVAIEAVRRLGAADLVAEHVPASLDRSTRGQVLVGCCSADQIDLFDKYAEQFDVVLTDHGDRELPAAFVAVDRLDEGFQQVADAVAAHPRAAAVLVDVLRRSPSLCIDDALTAESLAYSMLLAGPEFATWLARRTKRSVPDDGEAVRLERTGDELHVTLARPERHNAFNRFMRDQLCEALDVVLLDDSINSVSIRGEGRSFCSGGDLDEFGTTPDVVTAHAIRTRQSVGRRIARLSERVTVHVHGACIGAGVELPAFASRVVAASDATFRLPELSMGLIPGAGGTVSLPRRIGRWRTAWLAMTGSMIDAATALSWGLVDAAERRDSG